jgi:hypothetical protein
MSITNGYTTLAAFQAYANMSTITADETTTIEQAIEAASRTIDRIANRRFYMDANATARLYRTTSFYTLFTDDIGSQDGLQVAFDADGNGNYTDILTLNTDYILDPVTAPQQQRPFTQVTIVGNPTSSRSLSPAGHKCKSPRSSDGISGHLPTTSSRRASSSPLTTSSAPRQSVAYSASPNSGRSA